MCTTSLLLRYAVATALIAATAACSSSDADPPTAPATADRDAVLGEVDRATGEPVKIGWLGNGQSDLPSEATLAATAVAGYANTYLGGMAGRSVQLVGCENLGTPAGAQACGERFVREGVVAVGSGSSSQVDALVASVSQAGIPLVLNLAGTPSTFQTPGVFLLRNPMAVYGTPAAVARDDGLRSVAVVVPDVPAATGATRTIVPALFANAGSTATVTAVPIGVTDMTAQIEAAQRDDPAMWLVLGDPTFCTSAITAIRELDDPGRILSADVCVGEDNGGAIPGGLDGVDIVAQAVIDPDDPDYALFTAVRENYGGGAVPVSADSISGYQAMLSLLRAVDAGGPAELTPATVTAALREGPPIPYPLGGGVDFRCDGRALPQISPNICSANSLLAQVEPDGTHTDVRLVDTTGIYDIPTG